MNSRWKPGIKSRILGQALMYVTLLILFTLGKGVDYSALMERIGAALRKKEKYSEDFPEWFLFSWQDKGRWFIQITKR